VPGVMAAIRSSSASRYTGTNCFNQRPASVTPLLNLSNSPSAYPAQGLRDFSPGAKAISAIRPPFKATQEFLVTGYLSV
jgi:hypothetical protein